MKIIQIFDGLCYWDATSRHPTLESTVGKYSPEVTFVEAPDNVFEGWGYDETASGDARFIKPTPPKGWLYDWETGTFYPEDTPKPGTQPTVEEQIQAAIDAYTLELIEGGLL